MKDLIFRNLHSLKHEILKKSRRVIFFRFLHKGSKKNNDQRKAAGCLNFKIKLRMNSRNVDQTELNRDNNMAPISEIFGKRAQETNN